MDGSFVSKCASSSILQHWNFLLQTFDKTDYLSSLTVCCFSQAKAPLKSLAAFPPDMSKKTTCGHSPIPNWSPLLCPGREEVRARFTSPMTQFLLSAPEQARAMGGRDRAEPKGRSPSFLRNRFRIREREADRHTRRAGR